MQRSMERTEVMAEWLLEFNNHDVGAMLASLDASEAIHRADNTGCVMFVSGVGANHYS
jgi:hypothetical protein